MMAFQRITNGQRAAVCGLMIAGLTMPEACAIVDVSQKHMSRALPPRWAISPSKNWKWTDDLLADAYIGWRSAEPVADIAARLGVTAAALRRTAVRYRWPDRRKYAAPKKITVRSLSPGQLYLYRKLRIALPHAEALAGALAGWRSHEGSASL